jgi:hypothetical protein
MNSKRIFCIICSTALLTTTSVALGASRGGGGNFSGTSARGGGGNFTGMPARSGSSFGRSGVGAPNRHWSGGSTRNWSDHNWNRGSTRNWNGRNWSGNWRNWNRHPRVINRTVFIGGFGFPWWWGWGWGWGWGYPYGYYGYYPYDYYGYGYGQYGYGPSGDGYDYGQYGDSSKSRVAELQRRLTKAGYYRGAIDGILGPQTRAAIRAYEREHGDVG